jgi:hypothetical protein
MNHHDPLANRRRMLQRALVGCGLSSLTAYGSLGMQSVGAGPATANAAAPSLGPHFRPRAKRVIHLFMNGGPFQADLLDPKPALIKYAGDKPQGADLLTERPTGGLLPSPFKFRPMEPAV